MMSIFATTGMIFLTGCPKPPEPMPYVKKAPSDQIAAGKALYESACAMCHYGGSGSQTAPDLIGSPILVEQPERLIRIILHGQSGESVVNGEKFNGLMPSQEGLSDEEIAAITAYVRREFGGISEGVSLQAVASEREK